MMSLENKNNNLVVCSQFKNIVKKGEIKVKQIDRVFLDDEGNKTCKDGDLVHWFTCMECNEHVIAKEVYKNQNVVCPFCKNKFKVRIYKNGRIDISIR